MQTRRVTRNATAAQSPVPVEPESPPSSAVQALMRLGGGKKHRTVRFSDETKAHDSTPAKYQRHLDAQARGIKDGERARDTRRQSDERESRSKCFLLSCMFIVQCPVTSSTLSATHLRWHLIPHKYVCTT